MSAPSADNDDDSTHRRSRRRFLLGLGATTAVAGCLGGDSSTDNNDTSATDTDTTAPPESTEGTPTPDDDGASAGSGDSYELSRAEARELVPPKELALRYEPPLGSPLGEFWVAVVGETEAAALRAVSASGNYNQVEPQDGSIEGYLGVPVQVDPAGDEVTAFAIDESGARGPVLTATVPTDDLSAEAARRVVPTDALSFDYTPPDSGNFGSLTIGVTAETGADTLVAQPRNAPGVFADRVGDLRTDATLDPGTTAEVAVDPAGDEVVVSASADSATGEVARWQGPDNT